MMQRHPAALEDGEYDLLIIGGGIYGAWTAYDAALRGMRVALVEQTDWGSGTSSASSKLIHGGLRYLEYGHFGLVNKTLQERARLLRLGPHRVWPLRFLLPLTPDGRAGRWVTKIGLTLYDVMAGRHAGVPAHRYVSRETMSHDVPWALHDDVSGGFQYSDAGTDDARLTLELVDGALSAGAIAINHARCTAINRDAIGKAIGATVIDVLTQQAYVVRSRVTVVTAGPWCSEVIDSTPLPLRFSKGVHLVMPPLPHLNDHDGNHQAALLTTPKDKRVFFLIPWYNATLLGTTDTDFHGIPENAQVTEHDIDYLIHAIQDRCPQLGWTKEHVRGSFAGLRSLIDNGNNNVGSVSREWSLIEAHKNVLVSLGGKLTSARIEAANTVDRCERLLGRQFAPCSTHQRMLPWAPPAAATSEGWSHWLQQTVSQGVACGLDKSTAQTCAHRYGQRITLLFDHLKQNPSAAQRIDARYPFCQGEIMMAMTHEMAIDHNDVFRRRMPLLPLGVMPQFLKLR